MPCPAAGTADSPPARGQPPPHPLASRAFAFAWQAALRRGQTRRAQQKHPRLNGPGGQRCGFALARLPFAWCGSSPVFGFLFTRIDVFTILPELLPFFKRNHTGSCAVFALFPRGAWLFPKTPFIMKQNELLSCCPALPNGKPRKQTVLPSVFKNSLQCVFDEFAFALHSPAAGALTGRKARRMIYAY